MLRFIGLLFSSKVAAVATDHPPAEAARQVQEASRSGEGGRSSPPAFSRFRRRALQGKRCDDEKYVYYRHVVPVIGVWLGFRRQHSAACSSLAGVVPAAIDRSLLRGLSAATEAGERNVVKTPEILSVCGSLHVLTCTTAPRRMQHHPSLPSPTHPTLCMYDMYL